MAFIGKTLVLLFGAGSLMCLMWAAMVFTQKMDYFPPPKEQNPTKKLGRVEEAQQKSKDLLYANDRALTRWGQNFDEVLQAEVDRSKRRDFYKTQIDVLVSGMDNGKAQPPRQLNEPDVDTSLLNLASPYKENLKFDGKDLDTIDKYRTEIAAKGEEAPKVIDRIQTAKKESAKATQAINGTEKEKGLRTRIKEQENIEELATAETLYLEDFIANRRAEAQLFQKRRNAMEARVEELKKFFKVRDQGGAGN